MEEGSGAKVTRRWASLVFEFSTLTDRTTRRWPNETLPGGGSRVPRAVAVAVAAALALALVLPLLRRSMGCASSTRRSVRVEQESWAGVAPNQPRFGG